MFKPSSPDTIAEDHLKAYLADGADARMIDLSVIGVEGTAPCLVLRTVGRKSGRTLLSPLIYGEAGDEVVIIASKGGAPQHPAWYLNLAAAEEAEYKLGDDCWRASVRVVEGPERERLWRMMAEVYPPFDDYRASTDRRIPLIALKRMEQIPVLSD